MTEKRWYQIFYSISQVFVRLVYPIKYYGRENIPEDGGLICGNHSAAIDPFFIAYGLGVKRHVRAMAKDSLMSTPVVGTVLRRIGTFGVKRGESDIAAVKFALEQLKNKQYVILFPEGTRVKSREEGEPKTGAAMMATRTGCNVVPVYVPMKKKPFRINRVYFGEAYKMIPAGRRATAEEYETFTAELMDKIYSLGENK